MAYKVVMADLTSCMMKDSRVTVRYKVNGWVRSETPLIVFKHLQDAVVFIGSSLTIGYQIWRCRTKGLTYVRELLNLGEVFRLAELFWKNPTVIDPAFKRLLVPLGTYSTPAVMLTKRVR